MSYPARLWTAFFLCLLVVILPLLWISQKVLELEQTELRARSEASLEENVRLCLWRMDSAISPIIAQENARPYFFYSSFYPASGAYTRMFEPIGRGEILVPSPLLKNPSPFHFLHFQIDPKGKFSSPQVPQGNMRDIAEANYVKGDEIREKNRVLKKMEALLSRDLLLKKIPPSLPNPAQEDLLKMEISAIAQVENPYRNMEPSNPIAQNARNQAEWQRRSWSSANSSLLTIASPRPKEGVIQPIWIENNLFLIRRVSIDNKVYFQGCWLHWKEMEKWFFKIIEDLLPQASLRPLSSTGDKASRCLASLPVEISPGPTPEIIQEEWSPLQISLLVAWGFMALAIGAFSLLLLGVISLSERRSDFVSAVSHELRTPLTTFKMYAEMLASGMVKEEKKALYFENLKKEADRLGHLVENILSYARLEKRKKPGQIQISVLGEFFSPIQERLSERGKQGGMEMDWKIEPQCLSQKLRIDVSALEQILFNLVDNACKYGKSPSLAKIQMKAELQKKKIFFSVRDYGQGISRKEESRLFLPFSKSDQKAANSAPGIGLGLSLSRKLAKSMGGNLFLDSKIHDGACFVLVFSVV